ncbi:hypothetical protein BW730_09905 [Tessaracoccus aquimaris]|uniref:Uncharacterized protein n=1 Tax=Tessaracoccus aquimaris TaxID=1332264 RepID=A0A1Q2CNR8_9ACTN|nr:hypothetical protein [Tessaracoccus aquimaris]AQP47758.1 hypothetical protein BW730_09905 [Tessaracoccus aquimaris]
MRLDVASISLGLVAVGFGLVLLLSQHIATPAIQPILALILAAAGTIGLLLTRGRSTKKKTRKELT